MIGRYLIQQPIGTGAQSQVFRAYDRLSRGNCVLKFGAFTEREAFLSRELNHPFICRPYDYGTIQDHGTFAAYPFINAPCLRSQNDRNGDLRRAVHQISEFLSYLHHSGWIYNDFKPEHFLCPEEGIKVIDLGLCSRIEDSSESASKTYSGTFPYIAPERLMGQRSDARSDLFSLGVLILSLLLPDDELPAEPSLEALRSIQKKSEYLKGFWKDIVLELTAWEPAQRIGSAHELWKKLLPASAKENFLFYPLNHCVAVSPDLFGTQNVVHAQSPSEIFLEEVENSVLLSGWKSGWNTIVFDFRFSSLDQILLDISQYLFGKDCTDFNSMIGSRKTPWLEGTVLIIFKSCDSLSTRDRSMLAFHTSSLSSVPSVRILITSGAPITDTVDENWKFLVIGSWSVEHEKVVEAIFPDCSAPKHSKIKNTLILTAPEQLLAALRCELPNDAVAFWPSAARTLPGAGDFDKLTRYEKRLLAAVAIAGGSLAAKILVGTARNPVSYRQMAQKLTVLGYLRKNGDSLFLCLPPETILRTVRPEQVRELSGTLLSLFDATGEPLSHYAVARAANQLQTASLIALKMYRTNRNGSAEQSIPWLWRAHICGAALPKGLLFQMARYYLRRAQPRRSRQLIGKLKSRFGLSFRSINLLLEYYQRGHLIDRALKCTEKAARIAERLKNVHRAQYYKLKSALFLIHSSRLQEAESILAEVRPRLKSTEDNLRGLFEHCCGLLFFHSGKLSESRRSFKRASQLQHPLRFESLMNLGIVHGRTGDFQCAETAMKKSIRVFTKTRDSDCLAHACSNYGILMKQTGRLEEARKYYYRSIHLALAGRNKKICVMGLINLGNSFSQEGKISRSLAYYHKAFRMASGPELEWYRAFALSIAGLQYAYLGRSIRSVRYLKLALIIRQRLAVQADVGGTLENLGTAFLLCHKFSKARPYFEQAVAVFNKAGLRLDAARSSLYVLLTRSNDSVIELKRELKELEFVCKDAGFESGLWNHVFATVELGDSLDREKCRNCIRSAEISFRKVPSLFWLARNHVLKTRYLIQIYHHERALLALNTARDIFTRLGAEKELRLLDQGGGAMPKLPEGLGSKMTEQLPFRALELVREMLSYKDVRKMIEKILAAALDLTDMERAVLILNENPLRVFKSASVDDHDIHEICQISLSATLSATKSAPLVCLNVSSDPALSTRPSILANRILSIVCMPLEVNGETTGYLYLDSQEGIDALAVTERTTLEIFTSVIALALQNAIKHDLAERENEDLKATFGLKPEFPQMVGSSKAVGQVLREVQRLAGSQLPVLITGETGTGKELVARLIHYSGSRKGGPFVAINCSALTETLLESELFGHEKGAYTGAASARKGLFEEANAGTLLLDEIGDMPYLMQAKLLRVLHDGEFRRVGGNRSQHTNARILFATNRNLEELVKQKQFREDLYYRIRVAKIHLPPLRERGEDVAELASFFLKAGAATQHKRVRGFSPEAIELIKTYAWPGNVRQMKNEIDRMVAFVETEWITPQDFDPQILETQGKTLSRNSETLRELERRMITERLKEHGWNIVHAAKSLGLARNGLYSKMRILGISEESAGSAEKL